MAVKRKNLHTKVASQDRFRQTGTRLDLQREYQAIFEDAGTPTVIIEKDTTLSLVNAAFEKLSGYTREEIEGRKKWTEFVLEDDWGRMKKYHCLPTTTPQREPRNHEFRFIDREKRIKDVLLTIGMISGTKRSVASLLDITHLKRSEELLRHPSDESPRHQAAISALPEDPLGVLPYSEFNDAVRTMFDCCKNLIGATAGYVALLREDGARNEMLFLDSDGLPCTLDRSLRMLIRGLPAEACRTGKAVHNNSFSKTEWVKSLPKGHANLENVLFAPVVIEGKKGGLLGFANKPGGFTEDDARMASAFGELIASALHNRWKLESLDGSEERLRFVAQTASDAIISIEGRGSIIFWNYGAETMFGYLADEILGKPLTLIVPERFREVHQKALDQLVSTGESTIVGKPIESFGLRRDGTEFPLELSLATWKTRDGVFFTGIIRDISERKRMEETIRQLAYRDALTGLPNRTLFNDRLTLALSQAHRNKKKLAVMLLDLDRFKDINDTLGHSVGDQLLQGVSDRLKGLLRKGDTVARMGGDEFLLLFPEMARGGEAAKIARKIIEAFGESFLLDGRELHITASIGVALYPHDGEDADTLMKNADIAMYRAKEQGRNNYQQYSSSINPRRLE